jgi:hypothetical protein
LVHADEHPARASVKLRSSENRVRRILSTCPNWFMSLLMLQRIPSAR